MSDTAFVPLPRQDIAAPDNSDPASSIRLNRMTTAVTAVAAATYHWNIQSDDIEWDGDVTQIFTDEGANSINTGRNFAALLDPENFTSRFETVMRNRHTDDGHGVPFSIEYSIKPYGRDNEHSIWIEDIGRWYAGPDGRPRDVYGIVRQIDDRHERDQHLQFLGNCDPLTGMMNRGRLTEALGESIEVANAEQQNGAFLIIAINNLAVVNDAYGFDIADEVVQAIGGRLRAVVRSGDMIGRYSGSKFGLIMNQATREETEIAAERFLDIARKQVIETKLGPVWAMLSIGAVILPHQQADAYATMAHAEEALTEAMKLPSDGYICYEPSPDVESVRHLNSRCAVEIVNSLKDNRFTLAYQPIVRAADKQVAFHEALLRMACDDGEVVSAGHLVPISEKLGLVRLIDQSVVYQVLTALKQFPQATIALNISGVTANDPRWLTKITDILAENTDLTNRLTVEITETVALHDLDQTVLFVEKLHNLGCKVAIDDFGAGFTSFKNLRLLNADKVKIDGYFCQNLSQSTENQFFVQTLIQLAKKFGLEVVAEWVENQQDAELLTSWGADYLQGALFGMAESGSPWGEPAEDVEKINIIPSEILLDEDTQDNAEPQIPGADIDTQETGSPFSAMPDVAENPAANTPDHNGHDDHQDTFAAFQPLPTEPQPEQARQIKDEPVTPQPDPQSALQSAPVEAAPVVQSKTNATAFQPLAITSDTSQELPERETQTDPHPSTTQTTQPFQFVAEAAHETTRQDADKPTCPDSTNAQTPVDQPSQMAAPQEIGSNEPDLLEAEMSKLREAIFQLDAAKKSQNMSR